MDLTVSIHRELQQNQVQNPEPSETHSSLLLSSLSIHNTSPTNTTLPNSHIPHHHSIQSPPQYPPSPIQLSFSDSPPVSSPL
ncbi:hypothetical protein MtrunA17_Chr8g0367251 [Medicago truncatula]|uniref:Uncharacterized protein n=1 Tax=Medicago truncatula TaxID=3880 RepID=A0A396GKL4_MEDTR|nr:hypothetical protein MtrunA17_Chr8g0367251 [Medicago truncatula]